jgi:hypothetical protein
LPENARCLKVAGVRFFADSAEIVRKSADVFPSDFLVFAVCNP